MTMATPNLKDRRRCANACSNCKRRKERCDGLHPCQRCVTRGVKKQCHFNVPYGLRSLASLQASSYETSIPPYSPGEDHHLNQSYNLPTSKSSARQDSSRITLDQKLLQPSARLVERGDGAFTFLGSSSMSALLDSLRQFAAVVVGDCSFVKQASSLPESFPFDDHNHVQMEPVAGGMTSAPDPLVAEYLLQWYSSNPGSVYYLFEEDLLRTSLFRWLSEPQVRQDWISSKFYLILALGAQNCPENMDAIAEQYYKHGRSLTLLETNEQSNTSIVAAQCYTLMAIYLLGSSRIDAAFMKLGQAIRVANALGLHQVDTISDLKSSEYSTRECLWKTIRVLDCFLSVLLGRPMATRESRRPSETLDYSSTIDMCMIFETLISKVYTKQLLYDHIIQSIMELNRQWTIQFPVGLSTDRIQPSRAVERGGYVLPNLGLIHIKHAFYTAILLLTQKALIQHVFDKFSQSDVHIGVFSTQNRALSTPRPLPKLGVAAVQSAIDLVNLFRVLLDADPPPKRLPFVVGPLFHAALVVGFAILGDYYHEFHLEDVLPTIRKLLSMFSGHDKLARQYLEVLETLEIACQTYITRATQIRLSRQKALVNDLFGGLDQYADTALPQDDDLMRRNEQLLIDHEVQEQNESINTDQLGSWTEDAVNVPVMSLFGSFENLYDHSLNLTPSSLASFAAEW